MSSIKVSPKKATNLEHGSGWMATIKALARLTHARRLLQRMKFVKMTNQRRKNFDLITQLDTEV